MEAKQKKIDIYMEVMPILDYQYKNKTVGSIICAIQELLESELRIIIFF